MQAWVDGLDRLLHPHRSKQKELIDQMAEYRELSSLALAIGNKAMYLLLQREMNEMFTEYLTLGFLDGIGFLIPHVLMMWLLSLWFPAIYLPFSLPWIGNHLPVIIWYPSLAIMFHITRRLRGILVNRRVTSGLIE